MKKQQLSAKLEGKGRHAEIDNVYAAGEENADEQSTRWSTPEATETDLENQKHPAAVPATLDHFSTSPAKTRSKTTAARSCALAAAATQPGPSNEVRFLFYFDEQKVF